MRDPVGLTAGSRRQAIRVPGLTRPATAVRWHGGAFMPSADGHWDGAASATGFPRSFSRMAAGPMAHARLALTMPKRNAGSM